VYLNTQVENHDLNLQGLTRAPQARLQPASSFQGPRALSLAQALTALGQGPRTYTLQIEPYGPS